MELFDYVHMGSLFRCCTHWSKREDFTFLHSRVLCGDRSWPVNYCDSLNFARYCLVAYIWVLHFVVVHIGVWDKRFYNFKFYFLLEYWCRDQSWSVNCNNLNLSKFVKYVFDNFWDFFNVINMEKLRLNFRAFQLLNWAFTGITLDYHSFVDPGFWKR